MRPAYARAEVGLPAALLMADRPPGPGLIAPIAPRSLGDASMVSAVATAGRHAAMPVSVPPAVAVVVAGAVAGPAGARARAAGARRREHVVAAHVE